MPRATPLPPDERRASIIQAARPLLVAHGANYTTRQVADAAGIAEGTLFRSFGTKAELTAAVIDDLMDPTALCHELAGIDRALPLPRRVEALVSALCEAVRQVSQVFVALAQHRDEAQTRDQAAPHQGGHHPTDARARHVERADQLEQAITEVLADDASQLRCTPRQAAALVRSVAFGAAHPQAGAEAPDPHLLADLLVGGIAHQEPSC